jgi:hypothetical protein
MAANPGISAFRRLLAWMLLGLMLTGCATAPPTPERYGPASTERPQYSVMTGILNAMALPLYIPFKAAVCATTIVFAAPAAAVLAVTDPEGTGWQRRDLNEAFASNCGPPWLP